MKNRTLVTLLMICAAFAHCALAEEESEFSKHLQRKAADALWELGKAIFNDSTKASQPIMLTKATLTPHDLIPKPFHVPDFTLECERLDNKTSSTMKSMFVSVWSCGSDFKGDGRIDGVFLGKAAISDDLQSGYGFPNFRKEIPFDIEKAKQVQALKGRPQTIVVTVEGQSANDDKPFIQGWSNFPAFDFEAGKWIKATE